MSEFEQEQAMKYVTSAERLGIAKGYNLAHQKILISFLEKRFQDVPERYKQQIQHADDTLLECWIDQLLTAQSIEEVFKLTTDNSI